MYCVVSYRIPSYPGSAEEEEILEKAARLCFRTMPRQISNGTEDVEFTFKGEGHKTGDVNVCLKMKNDSGESRTVDVHFTAVSAYNTGVPAADLRDQTETPVIEPHAGKHALLSCCLGEWGVGGGGGGGELRQVKLCFCERV